MILAASNIAWSFAQRHAAYGILTAAGFGGLEIAPGLLFADEPDPVAPGDGAVRARLAELDAAGLKLVSMQALLFGVAGAALFGSPEEVARLVDGLHRAIRLAGRLGIPNLVFGSPRQRVIPDGMAPAEVAARVADVFGPLGDLAQASGTVLALEPNPAPYGTNFMTTFEETLAVVDRLDHPGITLNFDTGALHMTGAHARTAACLTAGRHRISHVHVSSAFLDPAPASVGEVLPLMAGLAAIGYDRAVSIEMKAVADDGTGALGVAVGRLAEAVRQTATGAGGPS